MNRPVEDREILGELIRLQDRKGISGQSPGLLVTEVGKFFLGARYRAGLLDTGGSEHLVVNLREFDCTTFVESVTALACCVTSGGKSFDAYRKWLEKVRYRRGRLQGYPSRLHYFSDWIHDNQSKGLIRDVTGEMGGKPWRKTVRFMTTHPDLYPRLRGAAPFRRMKAIERRISARRLSLIPKELLKRSEGRIHDGDLIAITTKTEGLDVQHVGFAARVGNRIHLLHASSQSGRVVLTRETLYRYLMKNRTCSGVMVARIAVSGREQED